MKVRCIDIGRMEEITLGKIYNVMGIDGGYYIIINDMGRRTLYYNNRFIPLKKERSEKISLLINMFG